MPASGRGISETIVSGMMDLSTAVQPEDVLFGLAPASKPALLRALSDHAAARLGVDAGGIRAALEAREALGSTGIGAGVAIPHTTLPALGRPFGALALLQRAIDFEAVDDMPVDIVFLLLTPADRAPSHLTILSCFARKARSAAFCNELREAPSADAAYRCLLGGGS